MSIQVNTGATAVNWESLLSKIGDVEKSKDVNGKDALTLTTSVGGTTKVYTISVPDDLEVPQRIDDGALDTFVAKLKDAGLELTSEQLATFKEAVNEAYGTAANAVAEAKKGGSSRGVMFDLYALMALLVEVAQKQRDASREMRNAENSAVRAAIQNQADEQRNAAMIGLVIGVVCGAASAIVSLGMMGGQAKAAAKQSNLAGQSGIDAATMKADMLKMTDSVEHAQQQLATIENKVGVDVANRVNADFNAKTTTGPAGNLRAKFDSAQTKLEQANASVEQKTQVVNEKRATFEAKQGAEATARQNYDQAAQNAGLNDKQTAYETAVANKEQYVSTERAAGREPAAERVAELDQQVNTAKTELDQAKGTVADEKAALDTASSERQAAHDALTASQNDLQIAQTGVNTATEALATAKADYVRSVQGFGDSYAQKYEAALQNQANPPNGVSKEALAQEVKTAKAEMQMARALEARSLALDANGVLSPAEQISLVADAKTGADTVATRLNQNEDYKAAGNRIMFLSGLNGIVQAIGGTLQSMTQNIVSMRQAESVREGAKQKEQEEMLDQTKDLFQQAQKLVDAVVQLMNAVRQAETQSMRDAIQA